MKKVDIYSSDAHILEEVADNNDFTVADIIEYLIDYLEEAKEDNDWV